MLEFGILINGEFLTEIEVEDNNENIGNMHKKEATGIKTSISPYWFCPISIAGKVQSVLEAMRYDVIPKSDILIVERESYAESFVERFSRLKKEGK